jgi:hypothetical protein
MTNVSTTAELIEIFETVLKEEMSFLSIADKEKISNTIKLIGYSSVSQMVTDLVGELVNFD